MSSRERRGGRPVLRILGAILYWLVVLAISLALVVALVLVLESRDESEIGNDAREGAALPGPERARGET